MKKQISQHAPTIMRLESALPKVAPDGVRNLVKKYTGRVDLPQAPDCKYVLLQDHACVGAGVKKTLLVPEYK
jgi:hypothetical protein